MSDFFCSRFCSAYEVFGYTSRRAMSTRNSSVYPATKKKLGERNIIWRSPFSGC